MTVSARGRLPLIDAFKAVASQLIVLHHLAFYGPMTDWTHRLWPKLVTWLSQDARMAVQVFLVISGFLAVGSLAPQGVLKLRNPLAALGKRYVGVALPYVVALGVAMACSAVARQWMVHDSIPESATFTQWLAHALLLHSVLDIDSLSAGVWYVAIDFQLFALLVAVLWLGRWLGRDHAAWLSVAMVIALGVASMLYFNLSADWDMWGVYFFGSFAAGCVAYWAAERKAPVWTGVYALVWLALAIVALELQYRDRLALALLVAATLWLARRQGWLSTWPRSAVLGYLGRISYGVFLMNFPISLLVNAAFTRWAWGVPWVQTVGVVLAWVACVAAGALFHHAVETPIRRWQGQAGSLWLRLATVFTRKA